VIYHVLIHLKNERAVRAGLPKVGLFLFVVCHG